MKKVLAISIIVLGVLIGLMLISKAEACGGWFEDECTVTDNVVKSIPVPQLTSSSERANVAERAKRFDNPNKISYVYLVNYGKVMAFYTVKGKISSLNSYMTPEQKVEYSGSGNVVVDAPDIDGTYGSNVEGIFFFTTEGAYVEWKGDYMMSDQPLKLTTPPELVREIK
jgi:hypothetical protein